MRRIVTTIIAAALLGGALAPTSSAGPSSPRADERTYTTPAPGYYAGPNGYVFLTQCQMSLGCAVFKKEPGERFVKIQVDDTTGRGVYFNVLLFDRGEWRDYCGTASDVIDVSDVPGEFWVTVPNGTCSDGTTPSAATTGTITATFSASRKALKG